MTVKYDEIININTKAKYQTEITEKCVLKIDKRVTHFLSLAC